MLYNSVRSGCAFKEFTFKRKSDHFYDELINFAFPNSFRFEETVHSTVSSKRNISLLKIKYSVINRDHVHQFIHFTSSHQKGTYSSKNIDGCFRHLRGLATPRFCSYFACPLHFTVSSLSFFSNSTRRLKDS